MGFPLTMLKYVLVAFAVPPGVLVLLAGFLGVWFLRGKRRAAGVAFLLFGALLWTFSVEPVSDRLIRGLESPYEQLADPKGDVIVLLGGGAYERAPDLTGEGAPCGEMLGRLVTAVRLQKRLKVPVLVSGGNAFRNKASEAPIVKRFLVDLGVPEDRIILEGESRDTRENANMSAAILRRAGYARPILVTSAFHMRRAVLFFERAGLSVTPFPTGFTTWTGMKHGPEDFLPSAPALYGSATAMREYLALLFYAFFP
jgi:uncharacterized SAM-binding protein YcdF (DUF218 family)